MLLCAVAKLDEVQLRLKQHKIQIPPEGSLYCRTREAHALQTRWQRWSVGHEDLDHVSPYFFHDEPETGALLVTGLLFARTALPAAAALYGASVWGHSIVMTTMVKAAMLSALLGQGCPAFCPTGCE